VLCDPCGRHFRKTKTLPKRKRRSLAQHFSGCHHCGSQFSPQWRGGPPDKPTLCNACGLHYRKTKGLPERPPQAAQTLMDLSRAAEQQQAMDDAAQGPASGTEGEAEGAAAAAAEAKAAPKSGKPPKKQQGSQERKLPRRQDSRVRKEQQMHEQDDEQMQMQCSQQDMHLQQHDMLYGGIDVAAAAAAADDAMDDCSVAAQALQQQHLEWQADGCHLDPAAAAAVPVPDTCTAMQSDAAGASGKGLAGSIVSPVIASKSAAAAAGGGKGLNATTPLGDHHADLDMLLGAAELAAELTADDLVGFSAPFSEPPAPESPVDELAAAAAGAAGGVTRSGSAKHGTSRLGMPGQAAADPNCACNGDTGARGGRGHEPVRVCGWQLLRAAVEAAAVVRGRAGRKWLTHECFSGWQCTFSILHWLHKLQPPVQQASNSTSVSVDSCHCLTLPSPVYLLPAAWLVALRCS
jgi:hypothetical protein